MAKDINKLSTGQPSTLNGYRDAASDCWGPDSCQVSYIDILIHNSPLGGEEEVWSSERDMVWLLSLVEDTYVKEDI